MRRSIANDRVARRVLDAMTAEKMVKVRFFEEGIKEQLRLRERLLADRAWYLEEIDRVRAETAQIKAETAQIKAELGIAEPDADGRGGAGRRGKKEKGKGKKGGRRGRGSGPAGPAAT